MDSAIKQLSDIISPQLKDKLAHVLSDNASQILSGLCPFLLQQLANYLKQSDSAALFEKQIRQVPEFSLSSLDDILKTGLPSLLPTILGNKNNDASKIIDTVSSVFSTSKEQATSLLSVASAMIFGLASKYLRSRSSQSISLQGWLQSQQPEISAAIPKPLLTPVSNQASHVPVTPVPVKSSASVTSPVPTKRRSIWPWILLIVMFLLGAWLLRGCGDKPLTDTATSSTSSTLWANLGSFIKKSLPDGHQLNIPEKGIENRLIAFIESHDPVSDDLWFSFDRLVFKTNSAQLEPESGEQLKNIAEILNAYPNVKIKLGGYTDNTGTEEINMALSKERAKSVNESLVQLGVAADRITTEGYGSAHPIAPNDTEENRAKNRRIDIRVTEK